jgi:hypothetical protein
MEIGRPLYKVKYKVAILLTEYKAQEKLPTNSKKFSRMPEHYIRNINVNIKFRPLSHSAQAKLAAANVPYTLYRRRKKTRRPARSMLLPSFPQSISIIMNW